jgi:hypothetical protein
VQRAPLTRFDHTTLRRRDRGLPTSREVASHAFQKTFRQLPPTDSSGCGTYCGSANQLLELVPATPLHRWATIQHSCTRIKRALVADVFLAYVSEDRTVAEKISHGLEKMGLSVWWDRHLQGGVDFASEIERQLLAAKAVVVLWSARSRSSQWVRDEAQQALDETS